MATSAGLAVAIAATPAMAGTGRARTATLHELGHTLGFMHPDLGFEIGRHIPGTQMYDDNADPDDQYPTVMQPGPPYMCDQTGILQADDHWAGLLTYPLP